MNTQKAIEGIAALSRLQAPEPKWMNIPSASAWSGLTERMIEDLARSGEITSSNVVREGNTQGRRLINTQSLDEFILAGVGRPPAQLKMNKQRKGGKA